MVLTYLQQIYRSQSFYISVITEIKLSYIRALCQKIVVFSNLALNKYEKLLRQTSPAVLHNQPRSQGFSLELGVGKSPGDEVGT